MNIEEKNYSGGKYFIYKDDEENILFIGKEKNARYNNYLNKIILGHIKASELCKLYGLKSLKELSFLSGESKQNLIRWKRSRPKLFILMLGGARHLKEIGFF